MLSRKPALLWFQSEIKNTAMKKQSKSKQQNPKTQKNKKPNNHAPVFLMKIHTGILNIIWTEWNKKHQTYMVFNSGRQNSTLAS